MGGGTGQWRGTRARAGRRDARRMGAAGRGAREEAALAYILVIVASSRSSDTATQHNSLRCSAGRHRTKPRSSARQRQQRPAASAELDSHSKRNGRCENCFPNSLLQQRMLAHTMDRCVLAVKHSFGCGTMRMHWKLQSVRRTPTTSTATQGCPAVSGTKSKRASWSCCVLRHQA